MCALSSTAVPVSDGLPAFLPCFPVNKHTLFSHAMAIFFVLNDRNLIKNRWINLAKGILVYKYRNTAVINSLIWDLVGSKSGALSGFFTATLTPSLILVLRLKLIRGNKIKDGCSS